MFLNYEHAEMLMRLEISSFRIINNPILPFKRLQTVSRVLIMTPRKRDANCVIRLAKHVQDHKSACRVPESLQMIIRIIKTTWQQI